MTFNQKKIDEFECRFNRIPDNGFILGKKGTEFEDGWCELETVQEFLRQALLDKEQDTLERVYGCIPEEENYLESADDAEYGYNRCLEVIKENLDKEFKQ